MAMKKVPRSYITDDLVCLFQDSYIQDRAETMQNIESTIVELGSIFQQLAHMVKEQEETVARYVQGNISINKVIFMQPQIT